MSDQRAINRMVLLFFNDLTGVPQRFDEVEAHVRSLRRAPCANLVERAITYLFEAGYLVICQATAADDELWKISAKGMAMAERQVAPADLDHMIWD